MDQTNQKLVEMTTSEGRQLLRPVYFLQTRASVYFLAIENNEVLLVTQKGIVIEGRNKPILSPPGGEIELGETHADALLREAEEEIGTRNIRIGSKVGFAENFFHYTPTNESFQASLFFYEAKVSDRSEIVDGGDEAEGDPKWYPISELAEDDFGPLYNDSFLKMIKKSAGYEKRIILTSNHLTKSLTID